MVHFYPELKVGYSRLVAISTDNLLKTNEFRDGEGAQWPFLSDPERVVQRDLDIQEYTDPTNDPMIPHTLVLEPELKIYKIYCGYWYWGRPSIYERQKIPRRVGNHVTRLLKRARRVHAAFTTPLACPTTSRHIATRALASKSASAPLR